MGKVSGGHGLGDCGQQQVRVDGFGDVFACALSQAPGAIGLTILGGYEDNGNVPGRLALAKLPLGLVSVHAGHDDIHQDNCGVFVCGEFDCLFSGVGGDDLVTGTFNNLAQAI